MAEPLVLDTSACFAVLENEPGADQVESSLIAARDGGLTIHISFVTLEEVEYVITQERGATDAALALAKLKAWPIHCLHSDDALCGNAAKLKAAHKIALADAFVAALQCGLTLRSFTKIPTASRWLALSNRRCCRENAARAIRDVFPGVQSDRVLSTLTHKVPDTLPHRVLGTLEEEEEDKEEEGVQTEKECQRLPKIVRLEFKSSLWATLLRLAELLA